MGDLGAISKTISEHRESVSWEQRWDAGRGGMQEGIGEEREPVRVKEWPLAGGGGGCNSVLDVDPPPFSWI